MSLINNISYLILSILILSCHSQPKTSRTYADIDSVFTRGDLTMATQLADSLLRMGQVDSLTAAKLNSMVDLAARIKADFTLSGPDFEILLKRELGAFSSSDRENWEHNNWLEYKIIDGKKHYFKRAVSNLKLILESKQPIRERDQRIGNDPQSLFCLENSRKVIRSAEADGKPLLPVKMKITYTLTVNPDAVPDGELLRCWLPWPHENHNRQSNVKLVNTVPDRHFIAPDTVEQRSLYLEQMAVKGKPTIFELQFEYVSRAQYFDPDMLKISAVDTTTAIFKKFTAEQYPQILFTNDIKRLSDSIVMGVSNPVEKVRKIYYWINDHIIWTGALEYSIIPFIPGYVLANKRGDCGMQTLLFMTMARYQHIPVKWQSGWMMHPHAVNLHDWCEVYYDGTGWVPLDMSFNLQKSGDIREKEFYISGIDAYRLIVNDGIGSRLVPVKKYPRSEPFDFQRGEVEWRGGNLYFSQWDYHMEVEYLGLN